LKNKLSKIFLISSLLLTFINMSYAFDSVSDYTGEAFFEPSSSESVKSSGSSSSNKNVNKHTTPPIKQLRQKLKERALEKDRSSFELAPTASDTYTGEIETSEYASKDIEDEFEETIAPDGFESEDLVIDEEKPKKSWFKKNKKNKTEDDSENIILDCNKVDYDTNNYLVYATGDVNVEFVKQGITVKSDIITFDRLNNTIKAEGNVRILKSGRVITGDYIFVDMNEENALIENPMSKSANIEIKSQKGYVYGDRIVQENGTMEIKDSFPIDFHSGNRRPKMRTMMTPKNESLTEDMNNGLITFQAQEIKIKQDGEHEIVSLKKPRLFKGDKLFFKTPSVKIYTNKNHDYGETDHWEIGSIRGLGLYAGPGFVAELPKGSIFKFIPMVNYKSGFGVGAVGRFHSGTNYTNLAYGTAMEKLLVYGKQELDDNLYLHYSHNAYMPEWFMGRRRPKYGAALVYEKSYHSDNFLLKDKHSSFRHRVEGGYFHDLDFDSNYEKIRGQDIGTTRFRYMASASQNFYQYKNEDELKAFSLGLVTQLSSSVYGTGDTQVIGRVGPRMHMQYKRWMQDVIYYLSAYDDNTPLERFDIYRYGQQSLYLRESFRVFRWLTLSWFGMMNLSNDAPNGKSLQENGFYVSVGPDDLKFNLGYDFVRETLRCTVEVMMDAKGTKIEYDKFEIVQKEDKNKDKKEEKSSQKKISPKTAPVQPRVLERAVVENIKEHEDVL